MKRVTIAEGVAFAVSALIIALCIPILGRLVFFAGGFSRITVSTVTLLYLVFLLVRSRKARGRVLLGAAAAAVLLYAVLFLPLPGLFLAAAGLIWAVRSLGSYSSFISCGLDLLLVWCGCAAAGFIIAVTGSAAFALWMFFLVQSLAALIPQSSSPLHPGEAKEAADGLRFTRAYQAAEAALRELA